MNTENLYTVREVSDILGISRYQVYRRIVRGDLPAIEYRQGNIHYMITEKALQEYQLAGGGDVLTAPRPVDPGMMRVSQVALETGYSVETIRQMCHDGRIPCTKGRGDKGHYRIPRSAIEDMLAGVPR